MKKKQRLFVDMDGTLSVFTPVKELEALYEKGYFTGKQAKNNRQKIHGTPITGYKSPTR